jgi:hypothetical protein
MDENASNEDEMVIDLTFVLAFIFMVVSLVVTFIDIVFLLPTLIFFSIWLGLNISALLKKGVDVKGLLSQRKVLPSARLPFNKRLRNVYKLALLTSLMVFFGFMLVMHQAYLLITFVLWLLLGYLTMDELGEDSKAVGRKPNKTKAH